jgi:hypothetical protein
MAAARTQAAQTWRKIPGMIFSPPGLLQCTLARFWQYDNAAWFSASVRAVLR